MLGGKCTAPTTATLVGAANFVSQASRALQRTRAITLVRYGES